MVTIDWVARDGKGNSLRDLRPAWQGEFHKVIIRSKQPGIHLEYRQGYSAHTSEEKVDPKYTERQLEQAACQDVLTSTSVLMVAKAFQETEKVRYLVAIEPGTITFTPEADGTEHVGLKVGLCSFDKSGKPLRFLQDTIDERPSDKQFAEVQSQHGFARVVSLVPTPRGKSCTGADQRSSHRINGLCEYSVH